MVELKTAKEFAAFLKENKLAVVVCSLPTCHHCHTQIRLVETAEKFAILPPWTAARADVSKISALASKCRSGVPVTLLYKGGKVVARQVGAQDRAERIGAWVKASNELAAEKAEKAKQAAVGKKRLAAASPQDPSGLDKPATGRPRRARPQEGSAGRRGDR